MRRCERCSTIRRKCRADPSPTSPSRALALAPEALAKFASLAQSDPSPVVRLHLAAALQRLPLDQRWAIAEPLARRAEDATDPNLPLMLWYGIEPLVNADSARFVKLVAGAAIPQVREFGARRFVDYAISQRGAVPLDPIVPLLATASDAASRDMLKGMQEALRGRKQVVGVSSWSLAYVKLKRSSDPEVRQLAAAIAVRFGDPEVIADLRKTVAARTAPSGERQAALESLIGLGQPDLATLLHGLLDDKDLRRAAVRGLATAQHANTPSLVLAQYAAFTLDEKQDAVATLTSRKEFALALLDAVEKKVVARGDISAFAARQLHALRDKKLTERLRVVWGEVRDSAPDKQQLIAKYKSQLTANSLKNADLTNGRLLFKKNCLQCHRMFGEGSLIGPDLTGSNRENIDYILSNILDPSAEISRDFRMSIVATKAGRILTGQVVESTPNRLTLQTATERVILARDDVEEVNESPLSMMPEGQLERLTKDEVRDLIGYLATPKQVPLPLGAVEVP